jgi:prepilin-type processing-associated H-X9-DG protein
MYVQDYDETYPYFAAGAVAPFCYPWDALEPYTKNRNVWICPSGQKENIGTPPLPRPNIGVSIEWFRIDEDPNDWYNTVATMGSVVSPSESIVLGDVRFDTNKPGYVYAQLQGQYIGCSSGIWQVHNNGANITFADGHAKWMSVGQIDAHGGTTPYRYCGIICKKGGANNWFDRE